MRLLIAPALFHETKMTYNVLFLCTGNSARSVLAEATLRFWGGDQFNAYSAGSKPTGQVNPFALTQLASEAIPTTGLRSKSWDEFTTSDAPKIDLLVTVCDSAAAETCPVVFGDFLRTHWGQPDPAATNGTNESKQRAFEEAHRIIQAGLKAFLTLPPAAWEDRISLKAALDAIGLVGAEGQASE